MLDELRSLAPTGGPDAILRGYMGYVVRLVDGGPVLDGLAEGETLTGCSINFGTRVTPRGNSDLGWRIWANVDFRDKDGNPHHLTDLPVAQPIGTTSAGKG